MGPLIPIECVTCFCLDDSRDDCLCECHPANRCTECGELRGPDCEAAEFYVDPANREVTGPGRKRRTLQEIIDNQEELAARFYAWGEDEPDDTDMTSADFKAAMARGIPCEIVTSRDEYLRRLEET